MLNYIKSNCINHHAIDFIENYCQKEGGYLKVTPKVVILLAELYSLDGKYAKSLSIIGSLLQKFVSDPYLLYYQSKYMFRLLAVHEALIIINSIIQYNQF